MDESQEEEQINDGQDNLTRDYIQVPREKQDCDLEIPEEKENKDDRFLGQSEFEAYMEKFKKEMTAEVTARIAYTVKIMLSNHLTEITQLCRSKNPEKKAIKISQLIQENENVPQLDKTQKKRLKEHQRMEEMEKKASKIFRNLEKNNVVLEKPDKKTAKKMEKYEKRLQKKLQKISQLSTSFTLPETSESQPNLTRSMPANSPQPPNSLQITPEKSPQRQTHLYHLHTASDSEFEVVPQPTSNDCVRINGKVVSLEEFDNIESSQDDDSESCDDWLQTGNMTSSQSTCIMMGSIQNSIKEYLGSPEPSIEVVEDPVLKEESTTLNREINSQETPVESDTSDLEGATAIATLSRSFQTSLSMQERQEEDNDEGFPEELLERKRSPYNQTQEEMLEKQYAFRASSRARRTGTPEVGPSTTTPEAKPHQASSAENQFGSKSLLENVVSGTQAVAEATASFVSSVHKDVVNGVQTTASFISSQLGQVTDPFRPQPSNFACPPYPMPAPARTQTPPPQPNLGFAMPPSSHQRQVSSPVGPNLAFPRAPPQQMHRSESPHDLAWFEQQAVSSSLLDRLTEMGFTDQQLNVRLLQRFKGQLDEVIMALLNNEA